MLILFLDIHLPGYGIKQPDSQFRPRDQLLPGPNSPFQYQKGTTQMWPTVVLEVARTQSQPELMHLMNLYLSAQTQINVFIGVKVYPDPANPNVFRRWWMGVYARNLNPANPSGPVTIGQLSHPHHPLLSAPQNIIWHIPINVLFHPLIVPPNPPSTPQGFIFPANGLAIDVDRFRRVILAAT